MYESHWNLSARPFENRHDGSFYYPSEVHQAALLKLRYAIENRRSAALLCGSSGMGKSLILQALSEQLPEFVVPMIHIVFPAMEAAQLIRSIANRIDPSHASRESSDVAASVERIERALTEYASHDKHVVVAIDEAHLLEAFGSIEPLRLLMNLLTGSQAESPITFVFCGQSTLLPQVQRNVSLDERIAVRCVLTRLTMDETVAYIGHRVRTTGGQVEQIFESSALETIHSLTQGIPRRINRLADLALMVGYAQESERVHSQLVEEVHSDLSLPAMAE